MQKHKFKYYIRFGMRLNSKTTSFLQLPFLLYEATINVSSLGTMVRYVANIKMKSISLYVLS